MAPSSATGGGIEPVSSVDATERTSLLENQDEEESEETRLLHNAKLEEYTRWLVLALLLIFAVCFVVYAHRNQGKKSLTAEIPIKNVFAFELVPTPLTALNPDRAWENLQLASSLTKPTVGSDIVYDRSQASFVGLTDATPQIQACEEEDGDGGGDEKKQWLPFPDFAPGMVALSLQDFPLLTPQDFSSSSTREAAVVGKMNLTQSYPLQGQDGEYVTSNPPKHVKGSKEFFNSTYRDKKCNFAAIPDPGGVDTEGLAGPLGDGTFIIGEEYGPSILHVKQDGTILSRFSPVQVGLPNAYYPVKPVLPSILSRKQEGRGFESAFVIGNISKTKQVEACGILQAPLDIHEHSLVVRIVCVDLKKEKTSRVYLLKLDNEQRMINAASEISEEEGKFIFIERNQGAGTVYLVDVQSGSNVVGEDPALDFEDPAFDFEAHQIKLLQKTPLFSYPNQRMEEMGVSLSDKIEGLAYINETTLALSNDNDYGAEENEPSRLWIIEFESAIV
jgi:hypothetical protein